MKKYTKLLLVASVAALLILLVACGSAIDSIMFEKEPRTTYVQGQELDFTDTVLVAMKKDNREELDLNSGDVTVTGYDKNTLGKQTVTFTYEEVSTTITVNVIPRITFEGVVTDYFVGDDINRSEGRIRVADDTGNTSTVSFNSELITVESFDSSTAGVKDVTISYSGYTASYEAKVYEVENVELSKRPKKTYYESHDTSFETAGAYFTVTANDGALSRYVNVTEDMIEGFEPYLATEDNLSERLPMTVTISYLGFDFDYDIFVRYSAVSYMRDVAESLEQVTDPKSCTEAQAQSAISALSEYFDLTKTDKALVDKDDAEKIALIVAYHGYEDFKALADEHSQSFILVKTETHEGEDSENGKYYGIFQVKAENYEAAVKTLELLNSEEGKELEELADTLRSIEDEFPDLTIDGENMDEYLCTVFFEDGIEIMTSLFGVMVEIYDELRVVPDDWTAEQLSEYKAEIKRAVVTITNTEYNPYKNMTYLEIFKRLSDWRPNNDIFDIIASYYLTHEPDSFVSALWEKVPLPGELNELYLMIAYGITVNKNMRVGTDTTPFLYYYKQAVEISERIKNGDNELEKQVYDELSFDYLIRAYFYTGENINNIAYVYHASGLIGNEKVTALYEKYLTLVTRAYTEEDFDFAADDVVAASKELFADFMALSPAERYGVCSMLHCDYRDSVLDESIFAYQLNEGKIITYNLFTRFILLAYEPTLSEEGFEVFAKLLVATENASLYNFRVDGEDAFIAEIEDLNSSISALDAAEQELLNSAFASLFAVYEDLKTPVTPDVSEYTAKLEELVKLINSYFALSNEIGTSLDSQTDGTHALLFATFERAKAVAAELLLVDDADLLKHLYYTEYTFVTDYDEDGVDENFASSLDLILEEMTSLHTRSLLSANVSVQYGDPEEGESKFDYMRDINAFYVYDVSKIGPFLNEVYDLLLAQYNGTAAELDADTVLALMNKKLELSGDGLFAMKVFNVDVLYYEGVKAALGDTLTDEVYVVLEKLLTADDWHAAYVTEQLQAHLDAYTEAIEALKEAYEALEDKTAFDEDFGAIYEYALEQYTELTTSEEDTPVEDTPAEDTPVEENPTEQTPAEGVPA